MGRKRGKLEIRRQKLEIGKIKKKRGKKGGRSAEEAVRTWRA
jgi:hypothetical protein